MVGATVSHYRILRRLGSGGMGVVYEAEDLNLARHVALKFVPPQLASNRVALERFRREARAASSLSHPCICSIYDFGEHEGQPFLVMELLQGEPLSHALAVRPLPIGEVLDIAVQIASALEAAHAARIVHRDIKPENIFVTRNAQAKLVDFGLAKTAATVAAVAANASAETTSAGECSLTLTGSVVGTLTYMSPEQVLGKPLDSRTDLFSLGVVLYECVTGVVPFRGENTAAQLDSILHGVAAAPARLNPGVPPKLDEIILKALEKNRDLRYQTASDLKADLQRLKRDSDAEGAPATALSVPTAVRHRVARRWMWSATVATLLVLALIVGGLFYFRRAPTLTEKDTVVLADYANRTGDAAFDATLKQALAVQLGQSPFLNMLSDTRVQEALRLMGRPPDAPIDLETARDICQRTRSAAVLSGSIANLGSQYILGLRAVNCRTGDTLAEVLAQAPQKEGVLAAMDAAAAKLRGRLGESLSSIQKFDAPIEQATTPSLDALKAFSLGLVTRANKGDADALPLFRRAVELDPNFAIAYGALGTAYGNLGQENLAIENIRKAYELRARASEREKFRITAYYDAYVTGDRQSMREDCEEWVLAYPRDDIAHGILADALGSLGEHEQAIAESRKEIALNQDLAMGFTNLAESYMAVGRFDEADATLQTAGRRNPDYFALHISEYLLAFLRGDPAGMQRQVEWSRSNPATPLLPAFVAATEAYYGRLTRAGELLRRSREQMRGRPGTYPALDLVTLWEAQWESELGDAQRATQQVLAVLPRISATRIQAVAALVLARAGDVARAQALAAAMAKRFPRDTLIQRYWLPAIAAAVALQHRDAARALKLLEPAAPYELSADADFALYPAYLRGEAFLALHRGAEAVVEFNKFNDYRGLIANDVLGALARLGLARAYTVQGDREKARAAYQDFFTLWKDADADLPILQQAKAEYARLK